MGRALLAAAAFTLAPACYVDAGAPPRPGPVNHAPFISFADAGCAWDGPYRDFVWWFEADVSDPDGAYDVVAVYADVYDDFNGGVLADSFELFPTNDPYYWYSDWVQSSTYLFCEPGYTVEITAYDTFDAFDVVAVAPFVGR